MKRRHLRAPIAALLAVLLASSPLLGTPGLVTAAYADKSQSSQQSTVNSASSSASPEGSKKAGTKAKADKESASAKKKTAANKATKEKAEEQAKQNKRKRIAQVVSYLQTLEAQLETATEDLNKIKKQRKAAQKKAKKAKQSIAETEVSLKDARSALNSTAKEIYKNGDVSLMSVLLGASDFEDFAGKLYLLESVASSRAGVIENATALKTQLQEQSDEYERQLSEAKALEQQASDKKATITESIEAQLSFLRKLDARVLASVNSVDSVKDAAKLLAKYAGSTSKGGSHPEIVKIASAYLGVPYVWGGESPSGFDCSGLTMYCYAKIGISLPHSAHDQYFCGKHIARSALMPGDLVFFGPNVEGIHHVGIYVGDGKYLQAPRTGDVVKVSSLANRSDYVGACRP